VRRGSMRRVLRRRRGNEVERKVGRVEWRRVIEKMVDGGPVKEGRTRRVGIRVRGELLVGVMMSLDGVVC
jgi:hypothetical protein